MNRVKILAASLVIILADFKAGLISEKGLQHLDLSGLVSGVLFRMVPGETGSYRADYGRLGTIFFDIR